MTEFPPIPHVPITGRIEFPAPHTASKEGVLAFGGNLSPGVLLSAYEQGVFPWYDPNSPVLWWSPDPRCVIFLNEFRIPRRKLRVLAKKRYLLSIDRDFKGVIHHCATANGRKGKTWLGSDMIEAYSELHRQGFAHSVELWNENGLLVGGLYGVCIGRLFCGESMFSLEPSASVIALAGLCVFLHGHNARFIDSQVANPYIESLGGRNIARKDYLRSLKAEQSVPGIRGWEQFSADSASILKEISQISPPSQYNIISNNKYNITDNTIGNNGKIQTSNTEV